MKDESHVEELLSPANVRCEIHELGWSPRDAYLADRVIYCEGESDHIVFTHVLRTLSTKNPILDGVDLEELGGDGAVKGGNIERVVGALQRVAPFAKHLVVLDSGIGATGERKALEERTKKLGAQVHFLKMGELEDYFLEPKLVMELAATLKPEKAVALHDIERALAERKPTEKGSLVLERIWDNLLAAHYNKVRGARALVQLADGAAAEAFETLGNELLGMLGEENA